MEEAKQNTGPPIKSSFIDVFRRSQLGYDWLVEKAREEGIPRQAVNNMIVGSPVAQNHAQAVLAIISRYTGKTWDMDNVEVSVLAPSQTEEPHD